MMHPVHIFGVPLDMGAGRRGVDMGPSALRIAGLGERIAALGYRVTDRGDLASPVPETRARGNKRKRYIRQIARVCQKLYHAVRRAFEAGALPIVLGGDHSLAAGSIGAAADAARHAHKPLGLIWIDAHADMNTPETTLSGNVHGMPLAAVLGNEPNELATLGGFSPKVRPEWTVLLGVRDLDPPEKDLVRASGINVFTMKDIDRLGVAVVAERAARIAGDGTYGIHLSFDLDACDPTIAPGVGTPVKGGLSYREAHTLMEIVADSGRLMSLDLVEINPILDVQNVTAQLGAELVVSALGKKIL